MSKATVSNHQEHTPSYQSYLIGFVLSVLLTTVIFFLVEQHVSGNHLIFPHKFLVPVIAATALAQAVVQLVCFLHLGREGKPRWKLLVFGFMLGIVAIVVVGSIWIMNNLDKHMTMSPEELKVHMHQEEGL